MNRQRWLLRRKGDLIRRPAIERLLADQSELETLDDFLREKVLPTVSVPVL